MSARPIASLIPTTAILADDFKRGKSYANWRPDGRGDWLIIYTVAGSGAIGLPQEITLRTRVGDLLLYEPHAVQDYRTDFVAGHWRLRWAHFLPRAAWHEWLLWPEIAPHTRLLYLPAAWQRPCMDAFGRMIRASRRTGPIQTELALAALEEVVLHGQAVHARRRDRPADPRIERAAASLIDGFKKPFHLPALARECGLSVSRLSFLFRRQMGKTPGQFVEEQRLSHAAHLLRRTALTVGEIAAECGFSDPFYFTNRFHRSHGKSPSRFRKKAQISSENRRSS